MSDATMKSHLSAEDLAGIIASYNDVTERLQESHNALQKEVRRLRNELAHKNRQLERRKRLAALGEMAAGLAHEIRNPLGGIRLYADLLRKDFTGNANALGIVQKIITGVRSLDNLVAEVLALTHTVEPKVAEGDLVRVVTSAIELSGDLIGKYHAQVSSRTVERLTAVCDRDMIHRAVLNVVRNAIEAAGHEGTVLVELLEQDRHAVIRVSDNGSGIGPEVADRIFNPFFTTKGDGTGLGLSIVHRIVEVHDGSIAVGESEIGGAMFTIKLPIDGRKTNAGYETCSPETDRGDEHGDDSSS